MQSTTKWLKLHLFDRSLSVIGTQMRRSQRRGIRFVSGKLLDFEQRHARGDQARTIRVTQIVVAKRWPQYRFLYSLLKPEPTIERCPIALRRDENLSLRRAFSQST